MQSQSLLVFFQEVCYSSFIPSLGKRWVVLLLLLSIVLSLYWVSTSSLCYILVWISRVCLAWSLLSFSGYMIVLSKFEVIFQYCFFKKLSWSLLIFIYLFIWDSERGRNRFCICWFTPTWLQQGWGWARPKQEPRASSGSPLWVTRTCLAHLAY